MSTLDQLEALVRARVDVSANDTGLTDTVLDGFINSALKKISLAADWEWLDSISTASIAAGEEHSPAPADLARYQYVQLRRLATEANDLVVQLQRVSRYDLEQIPMSVRGQPQYWSTGTDGDIEVRPLPDQTYTVWVRYYRTEPALTAGASSPVLPTAYDEGLVEYAAYLAFRFLHRHDEAKDALDAYNDWFRTARDDQYRVRGTHRVRVRPGSFV